MKMLILGLSLGVIFGACSMGKRSKRLVTQIDDAKMVWEFCTPKMTPNYQGKLCLVKCAIKLNKNGTCKNGEYKYEIKDLKREHHFFMNKYIALPEGYYY